MSDSIRGNLALLAAAVLAAAGGCADRLPPDPAPAPQLVLWDRPWSYQNCAGAEIRTPHYVIFTTHDDPVFLERLPRFMETAFVHYQRLIPPTKKPAGPMEVFLFGRRDQWEDFTEKNTGAAAAIYRRIQEGGYVDNGRSVFYDIRRLKTFAVTGHEAFHQYIWHYTRHRPPPWLDEGLACYFEGFFWHDEELRFQPRDNLLRMATLRQGLADRTLLDMRELLSTHPGIVIAGPSAKVASYYSQLWALMLFLRDGPHKAGFEGLLSAVGTARMMEQAVSAGYAGAAEDFGPAVFRAYVSRDFDQVGREFHAYCLKLVGFER